MRIWLCADTGTVPVIIKLSIVAFFINDVNQSTQGPPSSIISKFPFKIEKY